MSLIPAFEIGFWNAWIFVVPLIFIWIFGVSSIFKKRMPETDQEESTKDRVISLVMVMMMFGLYIYSIFLPFQLGTIWLYIGSIIYLLGMMIGATSMIHFINTPMNEPVTKGLYRFSRNPMFIAFFMVYIGISIACLSWIYLVGTLIFILLVVYLSPIEEKMTLEHYGKPYEEYMKRTPKWVGIPGSIKIK
jgi:protein-S-isoprenylcysteine O-methyltransferase Ste14